MKRFQARYNPGGMGNKLSVYLCAGIKMGETVDSASRPVKGMTTKGTMNKKIDTGISREVVSRPRMSDSNLEG